MMKQINQKEKREGCRTPSIERRTFQKLDDAWTGFHFFVIRPWKDQNPFLKWKFSFSMGVRLKRTDKLTRKFHL